METIYALSSGALPSGIAVVRLSGPRAGDILAALSGSLPEPRFLKLTAFRQPDDGALLDRGMAAWFPAPGSFTGEDVAELHLHGGRAVVEAVLRRVSTLGARVAQPGEFARRAFEHGKLDLTAVEGLADLIAAETEAQRRQALAAAGGALSQRAEEWGERLTSLRAEIEARLDFSDEADVPPDLPAAFWQSLGKLRDEMTEALATSAVGHRVREGLLIAVVGRPNAGKSSLVNALAARDVAIVTDEPGTTRDLIEVALDLSGYPAVMIDTAGLREGVSAAEQEGIRRTRLIAAEADVVLWLKDKDSAAEPPPFASTALTFRVRTKADLCGSDPSADFTISSRSGEGLPELRSSLQEIAAMSVGQEPALITRERQKHLLGLALRSLDGIEGHAEEVTADLLRSAGEAMDRLTGRIGSDDVLDRLFAEFCIGK